MSIASESFRYCGKCGFLKESNQLRMSTGVSSGCGCMALFTLSRGKPKEWILPLVNIKLFNRVLADNAYAFWRWSTQADHFNHGSSRLALRCEQVEVPEGIHLELMPSHSPELQLAERLWPLINEPIANRFSRPWMNWRRCYFIAVGHCYGSKT